MKAPSIKHSLALLTFVSLLSACGTAHVRTEQKSADLFDFKKIYINEVDVHSQEEQAKSNEALQEKMIDWEKFARKELEIYIRNSKYSLASTSQQELSDTLVANLDIDLVYGNRAARYFAGFGAGKGSVDSTLTLIDPNTQEIKFQAIAESDLTMGAFGGDMQEVLKSNIKKLIQQYPTRPSTVE